MRTYLKTIGWAIILGLVLALHPMRTNAQGVSFPGSGWTSYFYQPESGSYEAVSSEAENPRAFLGIMIREAEGTDGLEIVEFLPNSPAEAAGIPLGAILLTMDGEALTSIETLLDLLEDKEPGEVVKLRYTFDGTASTAEVTLGERPVMEEEEEVEFEVEIEGFEDRPMRWRERDGHKRHMEKRVIIQGAPEMPMMGMMGMHHPQNTLDLSEISVKRNLNDGTVELGFSGVKGKVEVFLMKHDGSVVETVVYESLDTPFEHKFVLGPGAQGMYRIVIQQGEQSHTEMIGF